MGITRRELQPGTAVMVPFGTVAGSVNGTPTIICYAVVIGPASTADVSTRTDDGDVVWLDVFAGPGISVPGMYHVTEILGVPAYGLKMPDPPKGDPAGP